MECPWTGCSPKPLDVTDIVVGSLTCGGYACGGVKTDGTGVIWGREDGGGALKTVFAKPVYNIVSLPADLLQDLVPTSMSCGGHACGAVKTDGTGVVWGRGEFGGDASSGPPTRTNSTVVDLTNLDPSSMSCGEKMCGAVKTDGTGIVWGDPDRASDWSMTIANPPEQGSDFTNLVPSSMTCGFFACAAVKVDGTAVAWGHASYGGDTQGKDVTGLIPSTLTCGGKACGAMKSDGTIVLWGHEDRGGADRSEVNYQLRPGKVLTGKFVLGSLSCGNDACGAVKAPCT
jgi:hypothetical protein